MGGTTRSPKSLTPRLSSRGDGASDRRWYHGTRYEFQLGDQLHGGVVPSNQGYGQPGNHVYYSGSPSIAADFAHAAYGPEENDWEGRQRVYQVEPDETHHRDPDEEEFADSWRARKVRVVREVPWQPRWGRQDDVESAPGVKTASAAAPGHYVLYHGAHHDDVGSILSSGLRGEPGQPTVTDSREGAELHAQKRDWTAPKVLEIHVPLAQADRYLDEPEQGTPIEGNIRSLRATLPPEFIRAVHEASLTREAAADGPWYHGTHRERRPGSYVIPEPGGIERGSGDFNFFTDSKPNADYYAASRSRLNPGSAPHVYEVEPTGDHEEDPDDSGSEYWRSRRSAHPLRVIREIPHNPRWKDDIMTRQGARWSPSSGIFAPTTRLDPQLFEGGSLRPMVRAAIMERIDRCIRVDVQLAGSDWQQWLRVWIAGGSASEWAGSRPNDAAQDLDVIVGLNLREAQGNSSFEGMDQAQAATALNAAFRHCFNETGWRPEFGGTWDLTAYCNPHVGSDITVIRPYAAWDLSDWDHPGGSWSVRPPHLPGHTLKDFDPAVIAHGRAVLAEARAILRMPEPLRTREARSLWGHVHEHRCQAFSAEGTGWDDPGNVDEKFVQYAHGHVMEKIKDLAMARTAAFNPWADGDARQPKMVPLDDLHGVASMNHPGMTIGEVWQYHHPEDEAARWHDDENKAEAAREQSSLLGYVEHNQEIPGNLTTCSHGTVLEDGEHRYMAARDADLHEVPVVRARGCLMPELHRSTKTAVVTVAAREEAAPEEQDYWTSHRAPGPGHTGQDDRPRASVPYHETAGRDPDDLVDVYRAAPEEADTINRGDWVTLHGDWARERAENSFEHHVLHARVPARHVWLDAAERDDDEAGYHGPPTGGISAVAAREDAWDDEDEDTDRYVTCDQGHDHWGARGAAGLLIRHQGRYLLQHRSPYVQHGGTWSTPGGALQHGESPERGAMREAEEEFGSLPGGLTHHHTFSDDHGGWAYHTVVMDSPHRFEPHGGGDGDWETQGHGWFTPEEMKGLQLHPGFAASWAKVRKSGAAQVPEREVREYEGTVGDPSHITRSEEGLMPTSAVAGLPGNRGERPGEHRNRQGGAWEDFKRDIAANGIRNPIFITVDHGQEPRISEGNHRRDAAVELGLPHVPVEVRYFGHAEREGLVQDRGGMRREGAASYEIKFEPDYHGRHRVSAWPAGYQGDTTYGEPLGSMQWHPEDGTVTQLHVRQTRSGVGTALWRRAQEEAARSGIAAPAHSPSRTPAADAWAQTVGGETPPLSEESQDPKWIASLPEDAQFRPRTAAYDPDSRIVRSTAELGWGDEEWADARREPWHAAVRLAQHQVRFDHPKLGMQFPDQHSGGDEMVGRILGHAGYRGDVSGAFVARHPHPEMRTSNPSWLRGAPGVALHPERWDYGTVAHEAAHHAVMYDHAAAPNEYQPDEQVHGPEWAGHYASALSRISKGAGDDFLEHHQFYRGMIDEGLQWKRPSDLDAADRRWREAGTPQNDAQRGLRRQGAAEFPEGIQMVGPEEYGKYQFPDYPPHRTLPALGRHLRRTNPAYYEKLRADVEANGVGNPMLVRFPGTPGYPVKKPQVMDGHHRGAVASELGIDIPVGDYHNNEHHAYSMKAGQQWWRDNSELKAGGIPKEAAAQVLYHGSRALVSFPRVPVTSEEDREIGRLAGFYTSTDPGDAARFGPHISEHRISFSNPLHVRYSGTGDPGAETWEKLTREKSAPEGTDIAAAVRRAGHDGVIVHHSDGREWHVALEPSAIEKTAATGYENLSERSGMIYLDIPEGKVRHLPGGVDDHHITLVYLGKDVGDDEFAEAVRRTREAAGAHPPMEGSIGGLGSFPPSDSSDGKKPVFVPVDVPGISRLRKSLEDLSASEHKDYKAHVTLAYLDGGEAMPAPHPTVPVSFARLHVKRGDEIESFPFLGHEPKTASTSQVYLHGSRHLWEPGDIIDPAQPHEVNWPEISGPSKVYLETQMPRATDWAQSAGHDGAPFVYHVRPLGQVTRDARSSDPDFADELRTAHETSHPVQVVRRIPVDDPYYQNGYSYRQATLAEVSKAAALPRFFHGTDSKLSEGDLIVPGRPKANAGSDPRHVYFTERYEHAEDAARGAASRHSTRYDAEHGAWAHGEPSEHYVYEVKPTGEWGQDQQLPWTPYSHQSAHPLQVVRDVTRSGGDPDVSKTAAWDRSGSERHGVYLRFGDWPHDEKSYSPAGGYKEEGVSVYDLDRHGDPSIDHGLDRGHVHDAGCDVDEFGLCIHSPDPGEEPDNDPQEEMQGRVHRAERHRYYGEDKPGDTGHLVKGEMSGVGYDGEPLLKNVRRVGDWIDHRHLFLDQAHPHRLARDPAAEDYEEPEEKAPYSYRSHE
jgi:8-oxo-dGTP diphosphatase